MYPTSKDLAYPISALLAPAWVWSHGVKLVPPDNSSPREFAKLYGYREPVAAPPNVGSNTDVKKVVRGACKTAPLAVPANCAKIPA